ncbi:MAG: transaldolase [Polyangiaceae bacterium]
MGFPGIKIQVYADGANKADMVKRTREGYISGLTTNPTLMKKAGITDYEAFAKDVLGEIKDLPISFEVFSDEFPEMKRQAMKIKDWAPNVNVKIPITNTKKESAIPLIKELFAAGIKLNITAIMSERQIMELKDALKPGDDAIISIFAGRIADTGVDPMPLMKRAVEAYKGLTKSKILWASPREVLNVYQAEQTGCHIITATDDLLSKLALKGKDLEEYSLDTVKMFYKDAQSAGFNL